MSVIKGLNVKGFYVLLDKEADRTLLHSPFKLHCIAHFDLNIDWKYHSI